MDTQLHSIKEAVEKIENGAKDKLNALNLKPDINEMIARDITNGFEYLQNNIRQIYFFIMPDYAEMPSINPLFFRHS